MGYWPHFQSVFLLEVYTGDAQIQPMVFILQFNFKIWGAPKWVTFPPLAKPHCHISEPALPYFDGHLLCCGKQTTSWLWIQNTFTCWVCLNLIDANTLSDATLESDCFKLVSASSADCYRIGVGNSQPSRHMPGDISFAWTICDLMSSHALKLKHQDKDPCTRASEPIRSQMLRICFALTSLTKL